MAMMAMEDVFFNINSPFFFALRNVETNDVLFSGRLTNPKNSETN